ncbi:MAG TPA: DUF3445 domain-containing protein, partial [Acetobacteraceae bacterium]|nr:DUF3445 domain-containing protein [Acetobacteraceae bacterium]
MPRQRIYLPFESGPYRMTMALTTVPQCEWFEIDDRYSDEMTEKQRLLRERRQDVFGALPLSDAARAETLHEVVANLTTYAPQWFVRDAHALHNALTGETWDLAVPCCDPLELAGRLVQEDLCVIQHGDDGPIFTAAVLCFPSRWRLNEKLGKPLAAVHRPVPHYAERLAAPVDRFMARVKPGHIASRLNWSVLDNPAMFQPTGKWREESNPAVTSDNAGEHLYLRVERQTLRRLPQSGAILFGIRVHSYQLARAIVTQTNAARLAEAVRALPEA